MEERDIPPDLASKTMKPEHKKLMFELIEEHEWARGTTRRLRAANVSLAAGNSDSLMEVHRLLRELAPFYLKHIQKEERMFFRDAMAYLSDEERTAMLRRFTELDASLIHEKYRHVVEEVRASA
jgi:hemerythrin-like domain-containing protein